MVQKELSGSPYTIPIAVDLVECYSIQTDSGISSCRDHIQVQTDREEFSCERAGCAGQYLA